MKVHVVGLLCLSVLLLAPAVAQQTPYPFNDPSLAVEKRIDNLLSLMTADEKVNCLGTRTGVAHSAR
jgi:beta-glucosidase